MRLQLWSPHQSFPTPQTTTPTLAPPHTTPRGIQRVQFTPTQIHIIHNPPTPGTQPTQILIIPNPPTLGTQPILKHIIHNRPILSTQPILKRIIHNPPTLDTQPTPTHAIQPNRIRGTQYQLIPGIPVTQTG